MHLMAFSWYSQVFRKRILLSFVAQINVSLYYALFERANVAPFGARLFLQVDSIRFGSFD